MASRRIAELVETQTLSPSVRCLRFQTADRTPVGHRSGQYLNFIVPTAQGLPFRRPYSIASAPNLERPSLFEIAVTRVEGGPTSEALHALSPGERVEIEGPAGTFTQNPGDRVHAALFVATGTGLAPLRAMLTEELRALDGPPQSLLFGCRTPDDILWRDELRFWERAKPRFRLHLTLSRPPVEWTSNVGYVQRHVGALVDSLPESRVYVCGLSAMVDDVVTLLVRDRGVAPERVHWETYD